MDNKLLTKKELCEEILNCDVKSAEKHFIFRKGFPYIMLGNQRRYPRQEVNKWIEKNSLKA